MRVGPFSTLTVTFRFVGYRTDGELGLALIFGTVQPIGWEDSAMAERRRIKHKTTLEDRLAEEADALRRRQISSLPARPGNYFYGGLARRTRPLTSISG